MTDVLRPMLKFARPLAIEAPPPHHEVLDLECLNRVTHLPLFESVLHYVQGVYESAKDLPVPLLGRTLEAAEATAKYAVHQAQPVAEFFEGPIHLVDSLACKGLDVLETAVPAVKQTPDEVVKQAKSYMAAKAQPTMELFSVAKDVSQAAAGEAVHAGKEFMEASKAVAGGAAETAAHAAEFGVEKTAQAAQFGVEKASQAVEFGLEMTSEAVDFGMEKATKAVEFGKGKAVQAAEFGKDKAMKVAKTQYGQAAARGLDKAAVMADTMAERIVPADVTERARRREFIDVVKPTKEWEAGLQPLGRSLSVAEKLLNMVAIIFWKSFSLFMMPVLHPLKFADFVLTQMFRFPPMMVNFTARMVRFGLAFAPWNLAYTMINVAKWAQTRSSNMLRSVVQFLYFHYVPEEVLQAARQGRAQLEKTKWTPPEFGETLPKGREEEGSEASGYHSTEHPASPIEERDFEEHRKPRPPQKPRHKEEKEHERAMFEQKQKPHEVHRKKHKHYEEHRPQVHRVEEEKPTPKPSEEEKPELPKPMKEMGESVKAAPGKVMEMGKSAAEAVTGPVKGMGESVEEAAESVMGKPKEDEGKQPEKPERPTETPKPAEEGEEKPSEGPVKEMGESVKAAPGKMREMGESAAEAVKAPVEGMGESVGNAAEAVMGKPKEDQGQQPEKLERPTKAPKPSEGEKTLEGSIKEMGESAKEVPGKVKEMGKSAAEAVKAPVKGMGEKVEEAAETMRKPEEDEDQVPERPAKASEPAEEEEKGKPREGSMEETSDSGKAAPSKVKGMGESAMDAVTAPFKGMRESVGKAAEMVMGKPKEQEERLPEEPEMRPVGEEEEKKKGTDMEQPKGPEIPAGVEQEKPEEETPSAPMEEIRKSGMPTEEPAGREEKAEPQVLERLVEKNRGEGKEEEITGESGAPHPEAEPARETGQVPRAGKDKEEGIFSAGGKESAEPEPATSPLEYTDQSGGGGGAPLREIEKPGKEGEEVEQGTEADYAFQEPSGTSPEPFFHIAPPPEGTTYDILEHDPNWRRENFPSVPLDRKSPTHHDVVEEGVIPEVLPELGANGESEKRID